MKGRFGKNFTAVLLMAVLVGAVYMVLMWAVLMGPSTWRAATTSSFYHQVGYLPRAASGVFMHDTYGFRGTGETMIAFRCPEKCIGNLSDRVERQYEHFLNRGMTKGWTLRGNDLVVRRTVDWITGDDPALKSNGPDPTSDTIRYFCAGVRRGEDYCPTLYALDAAEHRFWVFQMSQ